MWYLILIGVVIFVLVWTIRRQRSLKLRAHLMQEAMRNHDFTFRLPTDGLLPGERAMQQTLNQLGETIHQQVNQSEVESWERLTRVLTHEMMNATAPITSISQSLLGRTDVKGTPLEPGIQAIYDTSHHLSDFVSNYRKMSELESPVLTEINLFLMVHEVSKTYPSQQWEISINPDINVLADTVMLRQVIMNIVKNAVEAHAQRIVIEARNDMTNNRTSDHANLVYLYIGNDGHPIMAENRQSLFIPFFTTKRSGNGIGLSLSRRMMLQQGGMLELADHPFNGCHVTFILQLRMITHSN